MKSDELHGSESLSWLPNVLSYSSQPRIGLFYCSLWTEKLRCEPVRQDTLRNERIPGEFPTAAVRKADGSRVRKLRGVIYLHKTLIPSGSEQAEEEETEEREMKDGGRGKGGRCGLSINVAD